MRSKFGGSLAHLVTPARRTAFPHSATANEYCPSSSTVARQQFQLDGVTCFRSSAAELPSQTARQLPEQSTIPWVEPSSTGNTRPRGALFAVGTLISERPPHRSERAQFGHSAPTSGV